MVWSQLVPVPAMVAMPVVVVAMTVAVAVVVMTVAVVMVPAVAVPIVYALNGSGLARRSPVLAGRTAHRRSLCGHCREAQREGTRRGDKPVLGCHRSVLIIFGVVRTCSPSSRLLPIRRRLTPAWLMANAWRPTQFRAAD